MKHAVKHIHFVGVGGTAMSGIAEILHNLGFTVSGSDQADSATSRRLAALGIRVFFGHDAAQIAGAGWCCGAALASRSARRCCPCPAAAPETMTWRRCGRCLSSSGARAGSSGSETASAVAHRPRHWLPAGCSKRPA